MKLNKCIKCGSSESVDEVVTQDSKVIYKCNICNEVSNKAISMDSRLKIGLTKDNELCHFSVGIVIKNHDSQILLSKRRFYDHTWSIFFGHIHNGETTKDALKRELLEEAGVKPENTKLLFKQKFNTECRTGVKKHYCNVFEVKFSKDVVIIPNKETSEIKWVKPESINKGEYKPMSTSSLSILSRLKII